MYGVLIADDEPLMREALQIMISKVDGFETLYSVGTGEEAVEICKNNKVDIAFMDIMMPGESGIESSKKIYSYNPKTTIFIVSSYDNFDFAIEALNNKVKAYISKPVSFSQIKSLLDHYKIENEEVKKNTEIVYPIEDILGIVKEKDFKRAYYEITEIIEKIYSINGSNIDLVKEAFINIGQQLIDSTEIFSGKSKKIEDIFPMDVLLIKERRYFEFWLFKVINYVFQQNGIKKWSILKNIFGFIEEHIEEEIGLNEIINNCSVSQGYLSRIFKKQFNVSVMEYLHMRKINLAKYYFSFTDLSITDVAFKLGYNESSYFSKVFKKYENITVHTYKKKL